MKSWRGCVHCTTTSTMRPCSFNHSSLSTWLFSANIIFRDLQSRRTKGRTSWRTAAARRAQVLPTSWRRGLAFRRKAGALNGSVAPNPCQPKQLYACCLHLLVSALALKSPTAKSQTYSDFQEAAAPATAAATATPYTETSQSLT